jgi:hypothetical protein
VLAYGTGALNIDGTRIPTGSEVVARDFDRQRQTPGIANPNGSGGLTGQWQTSARWPANVILTDAIFDGDVPGVVGGSSAIIDPYLSNDASPVSESSTTAGSGRTALTPAPRTRAGRLIPAASVEHQSGSLDRPPAPSDVQIWPDGMLASMGIGSTPTESPALELEQNGNGSAIESGRSQESESPSDLSVNDVEPPNTSTDTTTITPSPSRSAPSVPDATTASTPASTGGYSRFFLLAKEARSGREPLVRGPGTTELHLNGAFAVVCAKCNRQKVNVPGAACQCEDPEWVRRSQKPRENLHPTVKPLELMRHLVRLVTPPGGLVLDPFLGSGTTAIAANAEGFRAIGIEKEREYVEITVARLAGQPLGMGLADAI